MGDGAGDAVVEVVEVANVCHEAGNKVWQLFDFRVASKLMRQCSDQGAVTAFITACIVFYAWQTLRGNSL